MFAIMQFTIFFAGLKEKKLKLVEVNKQNSNIIKHKHRVKEWLQNHCNNIDMVTLEGKIKDDLLLLTS